MGVANTFPMRNRSACSISGPQWPCVISFSFLSFYMFSGFPRFSGFQNRLGGGSKFLFSFLQSSPVLHLFAVTHDSEHSGRSVTWLQKLATPLGIARLQLSFSLFCLVAFSYLHDCSHVFALLACLVIHALIYWFVPCLYAYFTHAHHAYHMPFHVIHAFWMYWVFSFSQTMSQH